MISGNNAPVNLLTLTRQQGYALTTTVEPNNGQTPAYTGAVVRLDANYNVLWRYQYPGNVPLSGSPVLFTQVRELADGSLLALARARSNFLRTCSLYRFDAATGAVLNIYTITPQLPSQVRPDYLLPVPADSTLMLAGPAFSGGQPAGLWVGRVRIAGLPRVVSAPVVTLATRRQARAALALHCYPNPATDEVRVSYALPGGGAVRLEVRDMLGRVVRAQAAGAGGATVPVRGLAPGLYVVALLVPGQPPATCRLAVQR